MDPPPRLWLYPARQERGAPACALRASARFRRPPSPFGLRRVSPKRSAGGSLGEGERSALSQGEQSSTSPCQSTAKPELRDSPVPLDRRRRNTENFRRFFRIQPSEIPQLDDAGLPRIDSFEAGQRLVKGDDVDIERLVGCLSFLESDPPRSGAPLHRLPLARMLDEDASHELRRDGKKVRAILPPDLARPEKPEKNLVRQGSGLERVIRSLAAEVLPGQTAELAIHDGNELVECFGASVLPSDEELGDVSLTRRIHTTIHAEIASFYHAGNRSTKQPVTHPV